MRQLGVSDANFIFTESTNAPQHIGSLSIYDPGTTPQKFVRFKDILRQFETRIGKIPAYRARLAKAPFNVDFPFWVDDPNFDLEYHVRHIALPKPGDWRQLCIQVARLHSRPMDMSRPLWDCYVIEGLDNIKGLPPGCFAIYSKIHHAVVDGMGGEHIYGSIHDLEPTVPGGEYGSEVIEFEDEGDPSLLTIVTTAVNNWLKEPANTVRRGREIIPAIYKGLQYRLEHGFGLSSKPETRFDDLISAHRVFGAQRFSFSDIKAIRNAVPGTTVNDVAIAIISQAVRRYLADKGELPEQSIKSWMPISLRDISVAGEGGNVVSITALDIHTNLESALETLRKVHATTQDTKDYRNAVGADVLVEMAETMPAALQALSGRTTALAARFGRKALPASLTISNVPGPQVPLYFAGSKLVRFYNIGVLQHGMGLFMGVTSYVGELVITFLACRDQMPDPEFYEQCIRDSFDAFMGEVNALSKPKAKPAPRPKRKPKARQASSKAVKA